MFPFYSRETSVNHLTLEVSCYSIILCSSVLLGYTLDLNGDETLQQYLKRLRKQSLYVFEIQATCQKATWLGVWRDLGHLAGCRVTGYKKHWGVTLPFTM